jgi:hypothetical protein
MPGQSFERDIVHAFNDYSTNYKVKLIAYRHLQFRYQPQLFDVLVDCRGNELYLALECKSIDANSVDKLYFKKHFTWVKGVCQVVRESDWLNLSGRNGFLVVELRRGRGKRVSAFFVPWRVVWSAFMADFPCIEAEQITYYPCIDKQGAKYVLDDEFIHDLVKSLDTPPREVNKAIGVRKWR